MECTCNTTVRQADFETALRIWCRLHGFRGGYRRKVSGNLGFSDEQGRKQASGSPVLIPPVASAPPRQSGLIP